MSEQVVDYDSKSAERIKKMQGNIEKITQKKYSDLTKAVSDVIGAYKENIRENDITFIDYDGTYVASYSIEEAMKLTELPEGPDHTDEGLVFQEWNWTLEDIKTWGGRAFVGANYTTNDGKTRIWINLTNERLLTPALYFTATNTNEVIINWGDGTEESVKTTGANLVPHKYATPGDYMITMYCIGGTYKFEYAENTSGNYTNDILQDPQKGNLYNHYYYIDTITRVEIGDNCTQAVCRSVNLKATVIPKSVKKIIYLNSPCEVIPRGCEFNLMRCPAMEIASIPYVHNCQDKKLIVQLSSFIKKLHLNDAYTAISSESGLRVKELYIPDSFEVLGYRNFRYTQVQKITGGKGIKEVTGETIFENASYLEEVDLEWESKTLGRSTFAGCSLLRKITLPRNLEEIGQNCFNQTSLKDIVIPETVRVIGVSSFQNNSYLRDIIIKSSEVSFDNNAFYISGYGGFNRYYDLTKATVIDGVLSMTFGTNVFGPVAACNENTIFMFATKEIADVAKETTNFAQYADFVHYLGEEDDIND